MPADAEGADAAKTAIAVAVARKMDFITFSNLVSCFGSKHVLRLYR